MKTIEEAERLFTKEIARSIAHGWEKVSITPDRFNQEIDMSVAIQASEGYGSVGFPQAGFNVKGSHHSPTTKHCCGTLGQEGVITYIYGETQGGQHNRRVTFYPTKSDLKELRAIVSIRGGHQNQKAIGEISMKNIFILRNPLKGVEPFPDIDFSLDERRELWNCKKATINSSQIEGNEFETPNSLTIDLT